MKSLRIALCQINTTIGDLEGNTKKIIKNIKRAGNLKADIALFPELSIPGYPPEDLLLKSQFISDNLKYLDIIAKETRAIIAVIGFINKEDVLYNSAAVINNQKIEGIYNKIFLPNYGVFDEKRYFKSGSIYSVFKFNDITYGVNICEDIWVPGDVTEVQVFGGGAELIINISSSPYQIGKIKTRERMLSTRASDNHVAIVYTNLVGGQDELVFDGGSMIFDHKGNLIAKAKQFKEDFLTVDIDLTKVSSDRLYASYHKKPEIVKFKKKKVKKIFLTERKLLNEKPPIKWTISPTKKPLEEVYQALILGTRDYIRKNGFKKVVIGMSGGIDSALSSIIAVDALGKENVTLVSMPSSVSSKETMSDAQKVAKNLGTEFYVIPIENILEEYQNKLTVILYSEKRVVIENLQARIRGNILMAFANNLNCLVLTTGNKSETSVGYCTLYGDTAGGFAVIKDIPKTMVYDLAKFRNKKARFELIPESVIKREPSAELSPDQKDTDALPPYPVLDPILKAYVEEDKSIDEIAEMGFDKEIISKVIAMVDINEYKRRQSPIGIKITQKAFGKDRRLPITNKYRY